MSTRTPMPPHDHAVRFYHRDGEAVAALAGYAVQGLSRGEPLVVIATAAHRDALDQALRQQGIDPDAVRANGRYLSLDAARTLETFMVDGSPDPDRFVDSVGAVVAAAAERGDGPVRAFGEMVALLWDEGNVAGAIALEGLWNDLARRWRFSLLCAYPAAVLETSRLGDIGRVCDLHSEVLPPSASDPRSGTAPEPARVDRGQQSEVFLPVPTSIAEARKFVTGVLRDWGAHHLVPDAELVTSELATNALLHGRSPFRTYIHVSDDVVLIGIKDAAGGRAVPREATSGDPGGRGVAIVEALCDRWGCDPLPDGKIVWAEFTAVAR